MKLDERLFELELESSVSLENGELTVIIRRRSPLDQDVVMRVAEFKDYEMAKLEAWLQGYKACWEHQKRQAKDE